MRVVVTWVQAVVLGIVQGATEFIPVSSSGHLVLVPYLAGWERPGLAFDVALHMGSAIAIAIYFRGELWAMIRGVFARQSTPDAVTYRRVAGFVVIGSIPVAAAGLSLRHLFEAAFENPIAASGFLFVTAALLLSGEALRDRRVRAGDRRTPAVRAGQEDRVWDGDWVGGAITADGDADQTDVQARALPIGEDQSDPLGTSLAALRWRQVVVIGVAQCLALFPGVSRSGTTIVAGVAAGLTREAATRFSFLLSLPALAGAAVLSLGDLFATDAVYAPSDIALGVVAATVASYLAIRFLVALVSRDRLTVFARYCIVAGVVGLLGYAMIGPPSAV